ncbi:MAG: HAD hydrolase-like protein [Pseudomonadota bacterium]
MAGPSATVFFDLDGTLTDPAEGIVRCIEHALEGMAQPIPDGAVLKSLIGPPLRASFVDLVGDQDADEGVRRYRERFGDVGWAENRVYDGIPETLKDLAAAGIRLYVATSKPQVFAERILEHFELAPYFDQIFGSELDGTRSRKEELLAYAKSAVGLAGPGIMVGDRRFDVEGALANQLLPVGVTYGFGSRAELESAGAAALVDEPLNLVPRLLSIR